MGCPIRKSTDQSLFAAPHGLSQRITSFIACACQGIHQMPLRHLIVLIANAHPDPAPKRRTERGRTFAHSSDTANMRLRATAPHVLQRYPANMNAPTKSIHAGKKTSFQRRNPMMAVRHINPGVSHTCLQISNRLRNTRVDPKGDEPSGTSFQTEPHPQGTTWRPLHTIPQDPSSLHFVIRTGRPRNARPANLVFFLDVQNPGQPLDTNLSRMVEPVGIEPTTLCLQSRCSPS